MKSESFFQKKTRLMLAQSAAICRPEQGCQIFLGTTYQNGEKYTKWP
jgi:hypothetical protein